MFLIQAKYPGDKRLVFLVMLLSGINLQLGCIVDWFRTVHSTQIDRQNKAGFAWQQAAPSTSQYKT